MTARGLGLIPFFDPKNLDYMIGDVVPVSDDEKKLAVIASRAPDAVGDAADPFTYYYDSAWWENQGDSEECTSAAALHADADGPVTHPKAEIPFADRHAFYTEIQAIDRSEGRYFSGGATSLAMAKAMQRRGRIGEYRWGYSLADFIAGFKAGVVLLGINWYSGMDSPDKKRGIIRATGYVRGGHEIVCNGVNFREAFVRLKNSWGRNWGRNGHAYLPFEDLEKLIAEDGDVLLFRELSTARRVAA